MTRKMLVLATVCFSALAFAGKEEREFRKNETEPAIKKAKDDYKSACGADLNVTVPWDELNVDLMRSIRNTAKNIAAGAVDYCKDADSKSAMKPLKAIVFKVGSSKIEYKDGSVTIFAEAGTSFSFDRITKLVDK